LTKLSLQESKEKVDLLEKKVKPEIALLKSIKA
jgi:hypothetical protein